MRFVKSRQLILLLLVLAAAVSFSCRRTPPPPPVADAPPVPPPPPPPAPTITLNANPATITAGQSTTLTWQATNATTVNIDQGVGDVPASGTRQLTPKASITYNATATGPGGKASAPARVTVNAAAAPTPPPATTTKTPPPAAAPDPLDVQFERLVASQPILFDYDSSSIRSSEMPKLQNHAAFLQKNPSLRFTIEGHADERGSQEYNVGLADERAATVMKSLVDMGIAANRMTTISYGEERPVCTTPDEACYQRNRRAAFVLVR